MISIGIDVGKKGGIAILNKGKIHSLSTMPPTLVELRATLYTASIMPNTHCFIEKVHAMPGQGTVSMFNFGKGYGEIIATVEAMNIEYTLVPPRRWQKPIYKCMAEGHGFGPEFPSLKPKKRALFAAQKLYPKETFLATKRSKKAHDGLVDSLLIAHYGEHYSRDIP